MTVRGWGSSCQTLQEGRELNRRGLADGAPEQGPLGDGIKAAPPVHDVRDHLPGPRTGESLLRRLGVEGMQQLGAHLTRRKEYLWPRFHLSAPQAHQSAASTRISRWTKREASGAGMRWTTPRSPSRLPQAISAAPSGSSYSPHLRSSTSWYRAACTIGKSRGQFLQVDQPASVRVRTAAGKQAAPSVCGRRRRARGCRAGRPGPTAGRGHRHTRGRLAPRPAGRSDSWRTLGRPRPPLVGGLRPAAPGCWRVRSGAASNRRRWYRARSWHAPGWQVGWMSCCADGPLGRPAYAPPTPGSGSPGRGGMRWRGWERRGEIAGGRLVTGR